ncbi:MAG: ABC transporter substrate-binding protein [Desulfovibrionaceae bacterium]|nr:ABC transporter substrate-binding protein [Desulfovibrionaceae bacterium]
MPEAPIGSGLQVAARWLCLVLCAAFLSASGSLVRAADEVLLAMITAKTGKAGASNVVSFDGARFAVARINEQGGILGRPVRLLEFDNQGTPEGSAEAGRQAVEAGAVAVVGCNWSAHSLALAEVLQQAQIPMISHMSTNEAVTRVGDFIFRICFTDSFQGSGLARFVRENLNAETAVVLVDMGRTYSKGLAEVFSVAFRQRGGRVVWRGEYEAESLNADSLLREAARHKPDVLFVPGGFADVSELFGRARGYGLRSALVSGDGIGVRMYDYIGSKADGIYYSGHWSRWVDTPESRSFVDLFEKRVGPMPEDSIALCYDSFMVLREAIERAGSLEPARIRDALAATSGYRGVTGTIQFDQNGDSIKPLVIRRLKFGGVMYIGSMEP